MNAKKRQHEIWDKQLTVYLQMITWCEECGGSHCNNFRLSKAHRLKRRFIGYQTEEDRKEYFMAAKLGEKCHQAKDEATGDAPHQEMFESITELIMDRDLGVINGELYVSTKQWEDMRWY